MHTETQNGTLPTEKKRKVVDSVDKSSGEIIEAKRAKTVDPEGLVKKIKHLDSPAEEKANLTGDTKEANKKKIKWKKLITSVLRSNPDGNMKMKKLQKLVFKSLQESDQIEDKDQLKETLMKKINSSSRFTLDNNIVRLVAKSRGR